jgi:hypothetical protein
MRASGLLKSTSIAALLLTALAFGQAEQPTAAQQTTSQQTGEQPTAQPPAKPRQATPQSVAGAARASKQAQESAPPVKVYRNRDVKDPADTGSSAAGSAVATTSAAGPASAQATSLPASHPVPASAQSDAAQIQKDRAFEAQAKVFKSQILAEKGKIVGIQNRIADLKYQFDAWSTEYAQDPTDAQVCWTSSYYTPYYKDWCDTGRNLKAQYDGSQRQLEQEKTRLEQMQENIRHQGYGNAVYDPD